MTTDWEAVIGLEVHVQLATESKAFSSSATTFGAPPNSLTDPTVLGLPGALPVFNQRAFDFAIRLGLAAGCEIRQRSEFARKHYFYPDLPKGYQISQFDQPLCEGGQIEFLLDGKPHAVPLTRIHVEEDAGKSTHRSGNISTVDLNRAGIALCEVVSEPALRSADEAAGYMKALRRLARYVGVSEGNMERGELRCDANVSVRPRGTSELGTRTELKNINSFRFVHAAIEHEIARQIRIVNRGEVVVRETRLWDADAGVSHSMRTKEEADDYRYFPDPDLPTLVVSPETLADARASLPELPFARQQRFMAAWGLSVDDVTLLTSERALADYFEATVEAAGAEHAKLVSNWVQGELLARIEGDFDENTEVAVSGEALAGLIALIVDGTISGKIAKDVFDKMWNTNDSAEVIVEREGLRQISDTGALEDIAKRIVDANPKQAEQFRAGKDKVLGFFVGQVMKETQGKANPGVVNKILRDYLKSN